MNAPGTAGDSEELEALFDSIIADNRARETAASTGAGNTEVVNRIGSITRMLHDALRELGYDRLLERAAASIPDARERLSYVAAMTEQAAVRALNAIEAAQPIQDRLQDEALRLGSDWQRLFDRQMNVDEFKSLVERTRSYLGDVPQHTRATNAQLLEIMMAQDFQDLTGQVIKKITAIAHDMEQQLVRLLVDLVPDRARVELDGALLNGPVVKNDGRPGVITSQAQVDSLLESLGF